MIYKIIYFAAQLSVAKIMKWLKMTLAGLPARYQQGGEGRAGQGFGGAGRLRGGPAPVFPRR